MIPLIRQVAAPWLVMLGGRFWTGQRWVKDHGKARTYTAAAALRALERAGDDACLTLDCAPDFPAWLDAAPAND
jgi:hypothetical protein